jgi:prophage regulatory protein
MSKTLPGSTCLQVVFLIFFVDGYMSNKILMKLPEVIELTTFSSATIYRLIDKGEFPKQIKISERSSAWSVEEIYSWFEAKKDARNGGEL